MTVTSENITVICVDSNSETNVYLKAVINYKISKYIVCNATEVFTQNMQVQI